MRVVRVIVNIILVTLHTIFRSFIVPISFIVNICTLYCITLIIIRFSEELQADHCGLVHSLKYLSRQRQPGQKGRFLTSVSTSKLLKVLLIKAQCRQPGSSRETFND